jgi:hypothetical protein
MGEYPVEDEFDDEMDEDGALTDEDFGTGKRTANQSGARGGKIDVMPEDSIAPADRAGEELDGEQPRPAYPAQLAITITKPGSKAIEIRATAQDGTIEIDSLSFFPKESLLDAQNVKDASEARALYSGPPVDELDPELHSMLHQFLEERGIDEELASFLPDYMDFKEQREYVKWLEGWCKSPMLDVRMLTRSKQTLKTLSRSRSFSSGTGARAGSPFRPAVLLEPPLPAELNVNKRMYII